MYCITSTTSSAVEGVVWLTKLLHYHGRVHIAEILWYTRGPIRHGNPNFARLVFLYGSQAHARHMPHTIPWPAPVDTRKHTVNIDQSAQ